MVSAKIKPPPGASLFMPPADPRAIDFQSPRHFRSSGLESGTRLLKYSNLRLAVDVTWIDSRKTLQLPDDAGNDMECGGQADNVKLVKQEVECLRVKSEEVISERLEFDRVVTRSSESHSCKRSRC